MRNNRWISYALAFIMVFTVTFAMPEPVHAAGAGTLTIISGKNTPVTTLITLPDSGNWTYGTSTDSSHSNPYQLVVTESNVSSNGSGEGERNWSIYNDGSKYIWELYEVYLRVETTDSMVSMSNMGTVWIKTYGESTSNAFDNTLSSSSASQPVISATGTTELHFIDTGENPFNAGKLWYETREDEISGMSVENDAGGCIDSEQDIYVEGNYLHVHAGADVAIKVPTLHVSGGRMVGGATNVGTVLEISNPVDIKGDSYFQVDEAHYGYAKISQTDIQVSRDSSTYFKYSQNQDNYDTNYYYYPWNEDGSSASPLTFSKDLRFLEITSYLIKPTAVFTLNNDGATTPGSLTVAAVLGEQLPDITIPQRDHDEFLGYFYEQNTARKQFYSSTGGGLVLNPFGENYTLNAEWKVPAAVKITLDNQEATSAGTNEISVSYGKALPAITLPAKTGHAFGGYYTGQNGTGTQYYDADGNALTKSEFSAAGTLYAYWIVDYTVEITLDSQGGSSGTASVTVTPGAALPNITVPTMAYSVFGGYYTAANGGGTQYYSNTGAALKLNDFYENTTLYAKWSSMPAVTLTLNQQGGSSGTASVTVTPGAVLPDITVPTRAYSVFGGYYTAVNGGGTQYYASTGAGGRVNDFTGSAILYAKWASMGAVTLTLDQQGGSSGTASITVMPGEAIPAITVPTREYNVFGGYYTAVNGGGTQYYASTGAGGKVNEFTGAATLYAKWSSMPAVTLTLDNQGATTAGATSITVTPGAAMPTITVPEKTGKVFSGYYSETSGGGVKYYNAEGSSLKICDFTASDTLYAFWTDEVLPDSPSKSGRHVSFGKLSLQGNGAFEGGKIIYEDKMYRKGDEVILSAEAFAGYELDEISVKDNGGNELELTNLRNGQYSFEMVAGEVTLEPKFGKIKYYDDILSEDWFDNQAWYCAKEGLMGGTEERAFSGWSRAMRGQCITILKRIDDKNPLQREEGEYTDAAFADVSPEFYYAAPINWAVQNGIAKGMEPDANGNRLFAPETDMTREQLATILYNFARYRGLVENTGSDSTFAGFADAAKISPYAMDALSWACEAGIISGLNNVDSKDMAAVYINPLGYASRGEIATMIERFCRAYPELTK